MAHKQECSAKCKGKIAARVWPDFIDVWKICISSATEDVFESNWTRFCEEFSAQKEAIAYIRLTWLPWKARFGQCFTGMYPHF
jgi:hypothetical protein